MNQLENMRRTKREEIVRLTFVMLDEYSDTDKSHLFFDPLAYDRSV